MKLSRLPSVIYPQWPVPPHVKAFMTTRTGGVSIQEYESWNLADDIGDEQETVNANQQILIQDHHLPTMPLWLKQVHGNRVVCADEILKNNSHKKEEADASFTSHSEVVCAITTADCLPILLMDAAGTWVAAIHGGWRGLYAGIIKNTVLAAENQGIAPTQLQAWLGAAISEQVYEVGAEVYDAFVTYNIAYKEVFKSHPQNANKWYLNLYKVARYQLEQLGISKIYGGEHCTYSQSDLFFSYRRQAKTGRMATLIWLAKKDSL